MRLYLSSYGAGNKPEELASLVGPNKRALIIMNAADLKTTAERAERLEREITALGGLGFKSADLDLRNYFDGKNKEVLVKALSETDLVWVRGGNVFVLMRALRQSGFDKLLPKFIKKDSFVYGGYSAGAMAVTPSLHGAELVDNPNDVPTGYQKEIIWDGIGLVDFCLAPHYQSDHFESDAIEDTIDYYKKYNIVYKTLKDGQVIIIDGKIEKLIE